MIRRLALAALLALAPSLASAQFATIAPTPATSDNGDRIATTAWVNNLVNAGLPLPSGKIWIGSAGNVATAVTPSGDWTISNSGVAIVTQAAGNFQVIGNLTVGGSIIDGNGILATNIVAPATPAAGTTRIYVDSTSKTPTGKNDAGTISNMVVASAAVATQYMTGISAAGVITRAQPNFTDLAGQGTCGQEPALTGNVTSSAGSCATTIGANQVARSMEAQGGARSVIGVTGNATANVADIQGTANQFLGVNSAATALAFQTMSGDCTLSGAVITCARPSPPKLYVTLSANQSVTDSAPTLVNLNTVQIDSLTAFNTTTHLYTPTVAGWYLVTAKIRCSVATTMTACVTDIMRNGASYARSSIPGVGVNGDASITALVNVNGSSDTISMNGIATGTGGSDVFGGGSVPFLTSLIATYAGP